MTLGRLLLICAWIVPIASAAEAKDFGVINGKTVGCSAATDYRDKVLIKEFNLLFKDYESGKAARQKAVIDELQKHLAELEEAWKKAGAAGQKKVASNGVALALAVGSFGTGKWLKARGGLSPGDQDAADILIDRGSTLTSAVVSSGMTKTVDSEDLVLLPVGTLAVLFFPPGALGLSVYAIGKKLIQTASSLADYYLSKDDYQKDAKALSAAVRKIALNSVDNQMARVMQIKNEIDEKCN